MIEGLALDALFVGLVAVAGVHAWRAVEKEARWHEMAGMGAIFALAVAWAFFRLGAATLASIVLLLAAAAAAVPAARGVRRKEA